MGEAEATAEFTMTNLETGYEASVEAGVTASGEVSSSNRHGGASLGAEACAVCAGGGLNFNAGFDGCTASVGAEGSIKLLVGAEVNVELSANFCEIGDDLIKGFEELGQLAAPVVDKVAEEIERHVWNQGLKLFGEQIGHSIEHDIWNNGSRSQESRLPKFLRRTSGRMALSLLAKRWVVFLRRKCPTLLKISAMV